jgi:SOS-response transcriptional repressor LexA
MATEIFKNSADKIVNARRKAGYRQKEFSKTIGIPNSTYSNYERGVARIPEKVREILKNRLDLNDGDFAPDQSEPPVGKMVPQNGKRRVPVVSWALAGSMHGRGHFEDLANQIDEQVETSSRDPNAFAIEISGDSMEGTASPGDIVVFEPNMEPWNGMPVLVKLIDGRVFFKRLYRTHGKIVLESDNDAHPDLEFDQHEIAFIYPAKDIHRVAKPRPRRIERKPEIMQPTDVIPTATKGKFQGVAGGDSDRTEQMS